jgi:hypothetical protein
MQLEPADVHLMRLREPTTIDVIRNWEQIKAGCILHQHSVGLFRTADPCSFLFIFGTTEVVRVRQLKGPGVLLRDVRRS